MARVGDNPLPDTIGDTTVKRHPIAATFGASLALAGGITATTIRAADAATPPATLDAIHALVDAAVVADASQNYGLPVTGANCIGTGPRGGPGLLTDPGVACNLVGPNGFRAYGTGVLLPNLPNQIVTVGMVYTPGWH